MSSYFKEKEIFFNLLKKGNCHTTSSINNPTDNSLVFVRSKNYYNILKKNIKNIKVNLISSFDIALCKENIKIFKKSFYAEHLFAEFHNTCIHEKKENIIHDNSFIHNTSLIDLSGMWIRYTPDGECIRMKQVGNTVIKENVYIDAFSTIHKGTFESTIIKENTTISSHVNIGHNCIIGKNCIIGPHVSISGSSQIGNNVNIWQGSQIKNGIKICDNVVIGMGSIVTKDITKPGTYYGSPAKFRNSKLLKV